MNLDNFEILNPSQNGIIEDDGVIRIATNCGSMWGKGNVCQNLLLNREHRKRVTVEIMLDLLPTQNGEQAGIILFYDSDNYIKLVRELVDDKHVIVLAKELDGSPTVELLLPFESATATLTLMFDKEKLTAVWSATNQSDQQEKSFPHWFSSNSVFKAGVIVHGNTTDNYATVHSFIIDGQPH